MTLATVYTRSIYGVHAPLVTVEVHLGKGLPRINMVGMPKTCVKESKDRIRGALLTSHFYFPRGALTINLGPADLPKEGSHFDLPIALGILAASRQIDQEKLGAFEFVGELSLSGDLRPIRGILPLSLSAKSSSRTLIIPKENASEASCVKDANVYYAEHILEVYAHLKGEKKLARCNFQPPKSIFPGVDLEDVQGQVHGKRALEIAAAGNHSLLLSGPPGTGKTMLACRLPTILPRMSENEALEAAAITSISHQGFDFKDWKRRPFRAPHHSISSVALVGGGRPPKPGEISLAHHGVLFLDEFTEFDRHVLEALREPLESGYITISRAGNQAQFPAQFQLIAAMNPCPCGYTGHPKIICQCSFEQIKRYQGKISGPLRDRIDMQIQIPSLPPKILSLSVDRNEQSVVVRSRVERAREIQIKRQGKCNYALGVKELQSFCLLENNAQKLLDQIMQKFDFSARAYHRLIKVSRSIADLGESDFILAEHLSEAMTFRNLDSILFEQKNQC